jgi:hypothetical protein
MFLGDSPVSFNSTKIYFGRAIHHASMDDFSSIATVSVMEPLVTKASAIRQPLNSRLWLE